MKKRVLSFISAILAIVMLAGALAACGGPVTPGETTDKPTENTTEAKPGETTDQKPGETTDQKPGETTEQNPDKTTADKPAESTEQPTETTEKQPDNTTAEKPVDTTEAVTDEVIEGPKFESPYMNTILKANEYANTVQEYYSKVTNWAPTNGSDIIIENPQIKLVFNRDKATKDQYISTLANREGGIYLENTMDVYLKTKGDIYYLSKTTNNSYVNIHRFGYYYQDVRIERLNFVNDAGERIDAIQAARIFHTYADKLHHEIQLCTDKGIRGIDAIGFITEIPADRVAKLQVKDANGVHDTLEGVDWATAEYVGFDIIDAGVFGYILPVHKNTGTMNVTLEGGNYVITQESTPEDGKIFPGNTEVLNGNDYFAGQRLYTSTSHDFADLEKEAYIERNPLTGKNIKISSANSDSASFLGYDALRGSYMIEMAYTLNQPFEKRQNRQFETNFTVKGDEYERTLYFVTTNSAGALECAVLLDENLMVLPVPIEVGKNFNDGDNKNLFIDKDSNTTDHKLYVYQDVPWSEAIFPIVATDEAAMEYSLLHLYQNWGNFPVKQISFIEFWVPYYHLSTGMVETNCIYYASSGVDMLPDHRAKSAPYWANGAAHTSGGSHIFFSTKYKKGTSTVNLNTIYKDIDSYGPTYSDIEMYMLSDDGNIEATYRHTEMPQTDENRGYYTMTYTFLKDTNFKDFKELTSLYKVASRDNSGEYYRFGYLNENNQPTLAEFKMDDEKYFYKLGNEYPYFDLFYMPEYSGAGGAGYVNVSMLIKDYEVVINGQKQDVGLLIVEQGAKEKDSNSIYLTLDLEDVKFKAGDSITINAIILPWGSEKGDYSGTAYAPDQNVRDVRDNTLINPMVITAGEGTEVVPDVWVPKVRSSDGVNAEFTLSGGKVNQHEIQYRKKGYNMTVRVYGFTTLTAPKVYEKVNGEWVEYVLSSINTPDTLGYTNEYDGYMVHYDEDGTISYSFVINMTEAQARTFKVTTDWEFKGFKRIETEELQLYPYHFMLESQQVIGACRKNSFFYGYDSGDDGGIKYGSVFGTPYNEAYIVIDQTEIKGSVTGQYAVIKYRIPESNKDKVDHLQIFTGTEGLNPQGPDNLIVNTGAFEPDGKWHVLIIDVTSPRFATSQYVKADENGEIKIKYYRYDIYNIGGGTRKDTHWDIAYIAAHDNLEEILGANTDMDYVMLATSTNGYQKIDPKTGEVLEEK